MSKKRNIRIYLEDLLEASEKIRVYTKDMGFEEFARDEKTKDAVLRNLEVIGEAVKNIPDGLKASAYRSQLESCSWNEE